MTEVKEKSEPTLDLPKVQVRFTQHSWPRQDPNQDMQKVDSPSKELTKDHLDRPWTMKVVSTLTQIPEVASSELAKITLTQSTTARKIQFQSPRKWEATRTTCLCLERALVKTHLTDLVDISSLRMEEECHTETRSLKTSSKTTMTFKNQERSILPCSDE